MRERLLVHLVPCGSRLLLVVVECPAVLLAECLVESYPVTPCPIGLQNLTNETSDSLINLCNRCAKDLRFALNKMVKLQEVLRRLRLTRPSRGLRTRLSTGMQAKQRMERKRSDTRLREAKSRMTSSPGGEIRAPTPAIWQQMVQSGRHMRPTGAQSAASRIGPPHRSQARLPAHREIEREEGKAGALHAGRSAVAQFLQRIEGIGHAAYLTAPADEVVMQQARGQQVDLAHGCGVAVEGADAV